MWRLAHLQSKLLRPHILVDELMDSTFRDDADLMDVRRSRLGNSSGAMTVSSTFVDSMVVHSVWNRETIQGCARACKRSWRRSGSDLKNASKIVEAVTVISKDRVVPSRCREHRQCRSPYKIARWNIVSMCPCVC